MKSLSCIFAGFNDDITIIANYDYTKNNERS